MDNQDYQTDLDKERRNSNTEYMPTKCRITKPAPPKPATNPLQFIKVAPCPLFQKAQEQIKKVEEIKREEKVTRSEIEDWQTNLDNWKSSRRKRQEHIIERVVEVKKLNEQEETEKGRRRSKTFSEMMEDRSKGRHKFNIPLYEDDSNDLSDYGIGSSSSKTNSIKDADTDDSSSILDEKDNHIFDSTSNKENSSASNQSQSEDETNATKNNPINVNSNTNTFTETHTSTYSTILNSQKIKPVPPNKSTVFENNSYSEPKETKQYTYEGAIQDYRSRIQTINSEDSTRYTCKEPAEVLLPKGEIFKRKGVFEGSNVEMMAMESSSARRLSEDFIKTRSIKDRMKSFEQAIDQTVKTIDKSDNHVSVKQRLQTFNKLDDSDSMNNNLNKTSVNKISNYLLNKSDTTTNAYETKKSWNNEDRCFSPETELYVNKLNMFNRDLDSLMMTKSLEEHYAPSISSTELTCISSDREDSGIHTGDVSCSVSQADESVDVEIASNINERLNEDTQFERELQQFHTDIEQLKPVDKKDDNCNECQEIEENSDINHNPSNKEIKIITEQFLCISRKYASENVTPFAPIEKVDKELPLPVTKPKPVIYENVEIKKFSPALDFITSDFIVDTTFPDFDPPSIEPPKVKPPPPPPPSQKEVMADSLMKRTNSTKRIKREINIKRSSFLGLEEPTENTDILLEKHPNVFFSREHKNDTPINRKFQGGLLSKVESQDSGLDLDRGRLSSDTWCSSVPSHERQASELTNSITSEEDEITKKEREIIELVEKEEQYRDIIEYVAEEIVTKTFDSEKVSTNEPSLGSEQFDTPYVHTQPADLLDQDSEVLKVEQELRQLELEELERQRENMLFRESRTKAHLHSRHSLESLADKMYPCFLYEHHVDCRKSMPELAIQNASVDYGCSVQLSQNYEYENIKDLKSRGYFPLRSRVDGKLEMPIDNRKSMPDLQETYKKSISEHNRTLNDPNARLSIEHRKSMPELQLEMHTPAFKPPRPSIIPAKPLRAKDWTLYEHKRVQPVPRQLGAVHKRNKWLHAKTNGDGRNYNQHWLIQEAELRRISDQQRNFTTNANKQQQRPRIPTRVTNDRLKHQIVQCPEQGFKEDYIQQTLRSHSQSVSHALPTVAYSPPAVPKESHDRILSVSGKKKCSYCGNELGRGAAMIVESLCLFYHMDCFKCCVCHVRLGDGMMGTDVKVRNQKLHCHNCYSSDDGVKFSCV